MLHERAITGYGKLATNLGAGIALVCAAAALASPVYAHPLFRDRNTVDRLAPKRIGGDYACAVVSRAGRVHGRKLMILVTSSAAAKRARALRNDLPHPRATLVRVVSPRLRLLRMVDIRRQVDGMRPRRPQASAVGFESPLDTARCPRVELVIPPRGSANAEMERWGRESLRRFGNDRVVVRRGVISAR